MVKVPLTSIVVWVEETVVLAMSCHDSLMIYAVEEARGVQAGLPSGAAVLGGDAGEHLRCSSQQ